MIFISCIILIAVLHQHSNLPEPESLLAKGKGSHDNGVVTNLHNLLEAEMWELIDVVIPKIKVHWKYLAYRMRYNRGDVAAFEKDSKDLKGCCKKLFNNWLETGHGPEPKTYHTLLMCIKDVDNLTAASKIIEEELIKGSYL